MKPIFSAFCLKALLFSSISALAQLSEHFSDGNYNHDPAWIGEPAKFEVNSLQQLQLWDTGASGQAMLYTRSEVIDSATWEFWVRLEFNPSTSNYFRYYLISDISDLLSANGYFIKAGGTEDEVSLYLQENGVAKKLIDGLDGRLNQTNNEFRVRVNHVEDQWKLWIDPFNDNNWLLEGLAASNLIESSAYMGIVCNYTSTRSDKFYFDDILVQGLPFIDKLPPDLIHAAVTDYRQIELEFNEPIHPSVENSWFSITDNVIAGVQATEPYKLKVNLADTISNGTYTELIIQMMLDTAGNVAEKDTLSLFFFRPDSALANDLIINEFLADPTPAQGLPELEYVEIFNTSSKIFNLHGWKISDGSTEAHLPEYLLYPGEFLVIWPVLTDSILNLFPNSVELTGLPSLNNASDSIILFDQAGKRIDQLFYTSSWYGDPLKTEGGWSLERINSGLSCQREDNWRASENAAGGTPGSQNSIFEVTPDLEPPAITNLKLLEPGLMEISFNEPVKQSDSVEIDLHPAFSFYEIAAIGNRQFLISGEPYLFQDSLYLITIAGFADCEGNLMQKRSWNISLDTLPPLLNNYYYQAADQIMLEYNEKLSLKNLAVFPPELVKSRHLSEDSSSIVFLLASSYASKNQVSFEISGVGDLQGNYSKILEKVFLNYVSGLDTFWVKNENALDLYFDTPILVEDLNKSENFLLENEEPALLALSDPDDSRLVHLFFQQNFISGKPNRLWFGQIRDESGSLLNLPALDFYYDINRPKLAAAFCNSDSSIRLIYNEKMEPVSTTSIGNYQLDPVSGALVNVTPINDSTFDLHFSGKLPLEILLKLKILGPSDLAGNSINRTISRNLVYDTKAPKIVRTVVCADSIIIMNFSEPVFLDSATIGLDQNLSPDSVLLYPDQQNQVQIFFPVAFDTGTTRNIQISGVTDSLGNVLDSVLIYQVPDFVSLARIKPLSKDVLLAEWSSLATDGLNTGNFLVNDSILSSEVVADGLYQTILKFPRPFQPGSNRLKFIHAGSNQEIQFDWNNPLHEVKTTEKRQLQLLFSIELNTDLATVNFRFNDQPVYPKFFTDQENQHVLKLVFEDDFMPDVFHQIKVEGLRDKYNRGLPTVEDSFMIDNQVPRVTGFKLSGDRQVQITFSEPMVPSISPNHFLKSFGQQNPEKITWDQQLSTLDLIFSEQFALWENLIIQDLLDLAGNRLIDTTLVIENKPLPVIKPGELIFTEILFDPLPARGLPPVSYIEIKNLSPDSIRLDQVWFADKVKAVRLPATYLKSGDYIILTSHDFPKTDSVKVLRLSGFPDLNLTGDDLLLKTNSGLMIDEVQYRTDWLRLPENRAGGVSLERILDKPYCNARENWAESADPSGGTPGRSNSPLFPERPFPSVSTTEVFPDSIRISFNQVLAWEQDKILFKIDNHEGTLSADKDKLCFSAWRPFQQGELVEITISGLTSCTGEQLPDFEITTGLGGKPGFNELIISEIMYSPDEAKELSVEYLEIYNPTERILSCSGIELWKNASLSKVPDFNLLPSEYLILCGSASLEMLSGYGKAIAVPNFPALSNSAILSLKSGDGVLIFSISYQDNWHFSNDSKTGFALEMIDTDYPCGESWNWTSSLNPAGGTPGKPNSVATANHDLTDPQIIQILPFDESGILLKASEKLKPNQDAKIKLDSYQFSLDQYLDVPELKAVQLTYPENFVPGKEYLIQIENLTDCHGNISDQELHFLFPEPADSGDVVINEVLFNAGLGSVEFVELYNQSNKNIDISDWSINNKEVMPEKFFQQEYLLLAPGQYLALTSDSTRLIDAFPKSPPENVITVSLFALNNQESNLWLYDRSGRILDRVIYHQDYHHPLIKTESDVSLERIDPQHSGTDPSNWMSAASTEGFATPGRKNSCFRNVIAENQAELKIDPPIISPDLDGYQDFTTISCTIENPGAIASLLVYDLQGRQIKTIARRESLAVRQQFFWDGTDEGGNLVSRGYYLIYLELTNSNGNVQTHQQKIAVAGN